MKYVAATTVDLDGREVRPGEVVDLDEPLSYAASRNVFANILRPYAEVPVAVVDLRLAGAAAERQRIEKITALSMHGYEAIARRAITEGMTPGQFAMAQTEAQLSRQRARLTALRADEAGLDPIAPMVSGDVGGANEEAAVADGMVALHRRLNAR